MYPWLIVLTLGMTACKSTKENISPPGITMPGDKPTLPNKPNDDTAGKQQLLDFLKKLNDLNKLPAGNDDPDDSKSETPFRLRLMAGPFGTFEVAKAHKPLRNFVFNCPGDSILMGVTGEYNQELKDRVYGFTCGFWETTASVPMRAKSCITLQETVAPGDINEHKLQCPARFFPHGVVSKYSSELHDRTLNLECCQMVSEEGETMVIYQSPDNQQKVCANRVPYAFISNYPSLQPLINDLVNQPNQELAYSCEESGILNDPRQGISENTFVPFPAATLIEMNTSFLFQKYDRLHSFRCCLIALEPAQGQANESTKTKK